MAKMQRFFSLFIAGVLACAIFLFFLKQPQPLQNTLPIPLMKADSFIEKMEMEAFSPTGHLAWFITASDSLHKNRDRTTTMHHPYFRVYETNGKSIRWQAKSKTATAFHEKKIRGINHLDLAAQVEFTLHPESRDAMTLYTQLATFTPATALLTSEAAVQIESALGNIEGVGLSADLKSSKMHILKGVKGSYETTH